MATRFVTNPRRSKTERETADDFLDRYGHTALERLNRIAHEAELHYRPKNDPWYFGGMGGTYRSMYARILSGAQREGVSEAAAKAYADIRGFYPEAGDKKPAARRRNPSSKRRTAAQSNAAKAMKLFRSGQASSLAEAWQMVRGSARRNPRRSSGREIETMSYIEAMDTTRPKYTSRSPEELLLTRMLALKTLKQKFAGKSSREVAKALGFDPNDARIVGVLEELHGGFYASNPARKYDESRDDAGYRKLSDLKRGEFFKRKADARKTYRKGDYDRSERKYEAMDEDDISRSIYLKGDVLVYVGFDY